MCSEDKFYCLQCNKAYEIMNFIENEKISLDEIDEFENLPIRIVGYKENNHYTCELCEKEIEFNSYFCDCEEDYSDFLTITSQYIGEYLSMKIDKCNKCPDGLMMDDYYRALEEDDDENDDYDYGPRVGTSFDIFIGEFGIDNNELREEIIKYIKCPSCNHGANLDRDDYSIFELNDSVISQSEIDKFFGDNVYINVEKLNKLGAKYNIHISHKELIDFINYIEENPLIAIKHNIGKKLYELFENVFSEGEYALLREDTKIFRGRIRKKDESKFEIKQLWSPPVGIAGHGRYNLIGIPVLYCSNDRLGIPFEVNPNVNDYIDVGTFIIKKSLKLLDVSEVFSNEFGRYISEINYESKNLKKGYLFTNFIKDCCSSIGYEGIKYFGVKNEDFINYALFNFEQDKDIIIDENIETLDCDISYLVRIVK